MSATEQGILRIWEQLFKVEEIGSQSDFFDLGGHSFLLARLQIAIKKEFNIQVTAADIFRHPTVASLSAWMEQAQSGGTSTSDSAAATSAYDSRIIPIQPSGTGRPLFVISQSMIFRTLAAELGAGQPMYAIQMLEEDVPILSAGSFEDLVDFYVQRIRAVQPNGPYRLAGWCVSGWIAYGIARKLEALGAEIEMLVVVDSWAPGYWANQPFLRRQLMRTAYVMQRSRWVHRRLRKRGVAPGVVRRLRTLRQTSITAQKKVAEFETLDLLEKLREKEYRIRSERLERIASYAAFAGSLQGNILLFRSEEEPTGFLLSSDMGWSQLLGRSVPVQVLPGDHREIFDQPGAQIMAARTSEALKAVLAQYPPLASQVAKALSLSGLFTALFW